MADDALIRRENLNRLGKSPAELTAILGKTPGYWSNLMRDPKKSFGEKSARRIEEAWPLPRNWLDEVHDNDDPIPAPGSKVVAQGMSQVKPILRLPRVSWEELMTIELTQPFELVVANDALGPDIFRGCIARFDPTWPPEPGWPVLVRDKDGTHHLLDYQRGSGNRWQAVPRVARGFDKLDSEDHGLTIVAVMMGYDRPRPGG